MSVVVTNETKFELALVEDSQVAQAERALDSGKRKIIPGAYSGQIELELGARLKIKLANLPSNIISAFKRTATFANPKFFELERLRFSTWKTPRYIFCGELENDWMVLPRRVLDACLDIAKTAGAQVLLKDVRPKHKKISNWPGLCGVWRGHRIGASPRLLRSLMKGRDFATSVSSLPTESFPPALRRPPE